MAATILIGHLPGRQTPGRMRSGSVGTSATSLHSGLCHAHSPLTGWALCMKPLLRAMTNAYRRRLPLRRLRTCALIFLSAAVSCAFSSSYHVRCCGARVTRKHPLYFHACWRWCLDIALNPLLIFGFGPVPGFRYHRVRGLPRSFAQALGFTRAHRGLPIPAARIRSASCSGNELGTAASWTGQSCGCFIVQRHTDGHFKLLRGFVQRRFS